MRRLLAAIACSLLVFGRSGATPLHVPIAADAAQAPAAARAPRSRPAPSLPPGTRRVKVGVFELPPYATRTGSPEWNGIAVTLFREVSAKMGLLHDWVPYPDISTAVQALANGECDFLAVGLDPTPDRETEIDFSHAFEQSGTSAAVRLDRSPSVLRMVRQVLDSNLPAILAWVLGFMVTVAVVMTLIERRRQQSHFAGSWLKSLGESLWWSVTTMSTVGYGDRVPVTWRGKLLGGLWMLIAFALMSILAGVIASDLTVNRMQPMVTSLKALPKLRLGAVTDSAAAMDAEVRNLKPRTFSNLQDALEALQRHEVDAVLGDTTALKFMVREGFASDLVVLPEPLVVEYACIPISPHLPREIRDPFNYWVLRTIESAGWQTYHRVIAGEN